MEYCIADLINENIHGEDVRFTNCARHYLKKDGVILCEETKGVDFFVFCINHCISLGLPLQNCNWLQTNHIQFTDNNRQMRQLDNGDSINVHSSNPEKIKGIIKTFEYLSNNGVNVNSYIIGIEKRTRGEDVEMQNEVNNNTRDLNLDNILETALLAHKQIILTGAPGTGKTYSVLKYVNSKTNQNKKMYEFVQFHPSYDYSDFVEGLRPIVLEGSADDNFTFVRLDGTFKSFCREVISNNYKEIIGSQSLPSILDFELFKNTYVNGIANVQTKYYFIIDEINRADLSKVFGELMFSLESSYRGINNTVKTQYNNLKTYGLNEEGKGEKIPFDCFKEGFFIPENLYIIGTMNDIDKSVEAFDFALRRRFEWIEIKAKAVLKNALISMLPSYNENRINELVTKINAMNDVIGAPEGIGVRSFGLSEAYSIGHTYFKDLERDVKTLQEIFDTNILSILKEYTRGRNQNAVLDFIRQCANALGVVYGI